MEGLRKVLYFKRGGGVYKNGISIMLLPGYKNILALVGVAVYEKKSR